MNEWNNLTNFISVQYAFTRTIPIPTPYHIKNKLTRSLTPLTHRTAAILLYSSCHINNSWHKITHFKVIPSKAECNILTYQGYIFFIAFLLYIMQVLHFYSLMRRTNINDVAPKIETVIGPGRPSCKDIVITYINFAYSCSTNAETNQRKTENKWAVILVDRRSRSTYILHSVFALHPIGLLRSFRIIQEMERNRDTSKQSISEHTSYPFCNYFVFYILTTNMRRAYTQNGTIGVIQLRLHVIKAINFFFS